MVDTFPPDLNPYAKGEWMVLDCEHSENSELKESKTTIDGKSSEDNPLEEDSKTLWDNVLRGPIWNYSTGCCCNDLLFGKSKKAILTEDDKVIKGPSWTPRKPITSSFARQLFKKLKKAIPDSTALVEIETRRTLTYKEVIEKAKSVASGLRWIGITERKVIAVVSYNSLESQLVILASILVGSVFALIDPSLNAADIGTLLQICCPNLIFCECGQTLLKVETAMGHLNTRRIPRLVVNNFKMSLNDFPSHHFTFDQLLVEIEPNFKPAYHLSNPNNPLFILFTGGTTGIPKGALFPERFYTSSYYFVENNYPMGGFAPYTTLISAPMIWVGMISTFFLHLWGGHRIAFFRGAPSEAVLLKALKDYQVGYWLTGPNTVMSLVQWPARLRCHSLKSVFVTGAPFPAHLIIKSQNKLFHGKPSIFQIYGMTETGILTANNLLANKVGSVGRVYKNTKMKVVDIATGLSLGSCEEGELCFQLDLKMLGYYNNSQETELVFDELGYFHTGDLGFYDEQEFVYITGTLKDLIKWNAYQIIPFEVESKLKNHPAVKDAVVFGVFSSTETQLVTAAVILHPGFEEIDVEIICKAVNEDLSPSKHIRGGIYVFSMFPKTSAGKIIKSLLIKEVIGRKTEEDRDH